MHQVRIETQTDIALCVPKTVTRDVVGRDGRILFSNCSGHEQKNPTQALKLSAHIQEVRKKVG
jgi:hypothetical protein